METEQEVTPPPSRCWICGQFGVGHTTSYGATARTCAVLGSENSCTVCRIGLGGYTCLSCGVGWFVMPDADWREREINRRNELAGIGGRYKLPDFIDHGKNYVPSPA